MFDTIQYNFPKLDTTSKPIQADSVLHVVGKVDATIVSGTKSTNTTISNTTDTVKTAPEGLYKLLLIPDSLRVDGGYDPLSVMLFNDARDTTHTLYAAHPSEVYGGLSVNQAQYTEGHVVGEGSVVNVSPQSIWVNAIVAGVIIYFIIVMAFARHFVRLIFPLVISYQKTRKQFEENSQSLSYSQRLFYIPSICVFALFCFFTGRYFQLLPNEQPLFQLLFVFLTITGVAFLKHFLIQVIGAITLSQEVCAELLYNRQLMLIVTAIVLFPLAVLLPLYQDAIVQKNLVMTGIVVFSTGVILLCVRASIILYMARISQFLWILYLCMLEIAPYFALYVIFQ